MSWLGSSFGCDERPDEIHTVPPAPRHDVLLFNLAVAEQGNVWSETSVEAHKTVLQEGGLFGLFLFCQTCSRAGDHCCYQGMEELGSAKMGTTLPLAHKYLNHL